MRQFVNQGERSQIKLPGDEENAQEFLEGEKEELPPS
jgi:hypothetical protein